jgi:oxygen-independent coproporphyrinogen-3 oxidase
VRRAGQAHGRVRDYLDAVERTGSGSPEWAALTPREAALERLLLGLRTVEGAPLGELADLPLNARALDMLQAERLVAVDGGRLTATARGRPVLDRVCAELAA